MRRILNYRYLEGVFKSATIITIFLGICVKILTLSISENKNNANLFFVFLVVLAAILFILREVFCLLKRKCLKDYIIGHTTRILRKTINRYYIEYKSNYEKDNVVVYLSIICDSDIPKDNTLAQEFSNLQYKLIALSDMNINIYIEFVDQTLQSLYKDVGT